MMVNYADDGILNRSVLRASSLEIKISGMTADPVYRLYVARTFSYRIASE